MSDSSVTADTITVISVEPTSTSKPTWQPNTFKLDKDYVYIQPIRKDRSLWAEDNDLKVVDEEFVQLVVDSKKLNQLVTVNKRTALLDSTVSASDVTSGGTQYVAILISYEGPGKPPTKLFEREDWLSKLMGSKPQKQRKVIIGKPLQKRTEFKKVWNQSDRIGRNGGQRWHWVSVEFYSHDDQLVAAAKSLFPGISKVPGFESFRVECMRLDLSAMPFNVKAMLNNPKPSIDIIKWKNITQALLKKEFGGKERMVVLGNQFFDFSDFGDAQYRLPELALDLRNGHKRYINLNGSEPDLREGPAQSIFFKPKTYVADFFNEYWFDATNPILLDDMNKALRGKRVEFKTHQGWVERSIASVQDTVSRCLADEKHPFWRGKIGLTLRHTNLPCINVGTSQKHAFLPPELCRFVDGQVFKRPRHVDLQRAVSDYRINHPTPLEAVSVSNAGHLIQTQKPVKSERDLSLRNLIIQAFNTKTKVGFIEAGTDTFKRDIWRHFRKTFINIEPVKSHAQSFNDVGPLFLQYKPDEDCLQDWTLQLQAWKKVNGAKGETIMAIVLLKSDEHHSAIYHTLKKIGETNVGIQTYFVKAEVLEQKAEAAGRDAGLEAASYEVARRMALRNVSNKLQPKNDALDIAIGIHVERFMVKQVSLNSRFQVNHSAEAKYLVVLTSRRADQGEGYNTHVTGLIDENMVPTFDLASELRNFLTRSIPDASKLMHRITLLQSGYDIMSNNASPTSLINCVQGLLEKRYQQKGKITHMFLAEVDVHVDSKAAGLAKASRVDKTTLFLSGAENSFDSAFRTAQVHLYAADGGAGVLSMRVSGGMLVDATPRPQSQTPLQDHQLVDGATTSLQALSIADTDASYTKDSVSSLETSAKTEITIPFKDSGYSSSKTQSPTDKPVFTEYELRRLAKLWTDDTLGFYDTRFPVPLHLAQLAAKRARTHVRGHLNENDMEMEYSLKPVHPDVEKTLYYL